MPVTRGGFAVCVRRICTSSYGGRSHFQNSEKRLQAWGVVVVCITTVSVCTDGIAGRVRTVL